MNWLYHNENYELIVGVKANLLISIETSLKHFLLLWIFLFVHGTGINQVYFRIFLNITKFLNLNRSEKIFQAVQKFSMCE